MSVRMQSESTAGTYTGPQRMSAALLASAWCVPTVVFAGWIANLLGVWTIAAPGGVLLGLPAAVFWGRVFLWGWATAYLLGGRRPVSWFVVGLVMDVWLLQSCGVRIERRGLFGMVEIWSVLMCAIPAQYFARWTLQGKKLAARNTMHVLFHAGLILGVWPLLVTEMFGGNWEAMSQRSSWMNKIYLQLLLVPAVFLMTAMQEFYARGKGTPMPDDPPQKLVTSGIYAYVANPMQIGKFGVLAGWGLFWKSPWIMALGCVGLLYSLTIARWKEDRDMIARYGEAWKIYRENVRRWLPRWQPWIAEEDRAASLHLDFGCGPCAQLGKWLAEQRPAGLRVCSLEEHLDGAPAKITYRFASGGAEDSGIAAMARALEHIHLGWAFTGWMLRLPGICQVAQLIADAVSPANGDCRVEIAAKDLSR